MVQYVVIKQEPSVPTLKHIHKIIIILNLSLCSLVIIIIIVIIIIVIIIIIIITLFSVDFYITITM